jgi:hypothetical protein
VTLIAGMKKAGAISPGILYGYSISWKAKKGGQTEACRLIDAPLTPKHHTSVSDTPCSQMFTYFSSLLTTA